MVGGLDEAGRTLVGREHGFFDELVRLVACARHDLLDAAVVVADDLRLGGLRLVRAARGARLQQRAVDLVQVQQVRHQLLALLRLGTARIGEDRRDFRVREARMRVDDGREELVGVHLAGGVDHHVAHHREAVLVGIQRAQPVAELLRQHRNHAPREIDRGRALVGIVVQRLAGLHVVAYVGNGDDQAPAVRRRPLGLATDRDRLAVHGIVEIPGVLAIDGDQRDVGQIDALSLVGRPHLVGQLGRLRQRLGREAVRHLVLAHRDLDLHAGVVDLTQHLGHTAQRLRMHRRRLGQFDGDHLTRAGIGDAILRDHDVLAVALVLGRDQPDAALVQQAADDRRLAAFQDLEHPPFRPALAVVADHPHADAVAVQNRPHFLRRQIDVGLAIVALHEAVPIAVALDDALDLTHQCSTKWRTACLVFVLDAKISGFGT